MLRNEALIMARPLERTLLLATLATAVVSSGCGAEGTPAPPDPPEPDLVCRPLEESLPAFFRLLREPGSPLAGLQHVVRSLASGDPTDLSKNPVAAILSNSARGLRLFTKDPPESASFACESLEQLASSTSSRAPLCSVEAASGEACENRMCALRRALALGLHDAAAADALERLEPILAKTIGYMSNSGRGADGREHYEVVEVLHRTAVNAGRCSPKNLVDVIDGTVVFFRNDPSCGEACQGVRLLDAIEKLIGDPALQNLLSGYENAEADGSGRKSWAALARFLGQQIEDMPDDENYFRAIQTVVDLLYTFMDKDPATYGHLRAQVEIIVAGLRELLNPNRPNAILIPFKSVMRCINQVDTEQALVSAVYDLLSREGDEGEGLDVLELVSAVGDVVRLDRNGVLAGALHAVLKTLSDDDDALEGVRRFLEQAQTTENARLVFPVLQKMIEQGVIKEFLGLADELLYGCRERE